MAARNRAGAVTFSYPWRFITLFTVGLVWGIPAVVVLNSAWLKRSSASVTALAVTALAVPLIYGCVRALRSGMRMDGRGVTVRNFCRTYKISWPEVSHLGDASVYMGDAGRIWALGVVLRDGRIRTVSTTVGLGQADREEIRQAAARYGVPADLTDPTEARMSDAQPGDGLYEDPGGQAGLRCWDGSAWSPLLPLGAGKGWQVWKSNPAWAALPVAPESWVHPGIQAASAKAARAKVRIRACAAATAVLLAVPVVAGMWTGSWAAVGGFGALAGTLAIFPALGWLSSRHYPKLEERLRNLSAEPTSAR